MAVYDLQKNEWRHQKGGQVLTPEPGQESVTQIIPLHLLQHLPSQIKDELRYKQALEDVEENIYEPVEIYVYADGLLEVGDGNHQLEAARRLNFQGIKVIFVYVD